MEYEKKLQKGQATTTDSSAFDAAKAQHDLMVDALNQEHSEEVERLQPQITGLRQQLDAEKEERRATSAAESTLRAKLTGQLEEWLG